MSLQGDLSTLDLVGLFQNLEAAQKCGLLSIRDGESLTQLYFQQGRLALVTYPNRPSLIEFMLAAGDVTPEALAAAKKHRRRNQLLSHALVELGALTEDRVHELVTMRVTDDACELLAAGSGQFELTEGALPDGTFDPDERAAELALAASPLLLEAARRLDHWKVIRERIPSDSTHYVLARAPRARLSPKQAHLLERMTPLLDGTRSVSEVVAAFPHERLEAYEMLSELAESQSIRLAASSDLNRTVLDLARHDKDRAWALLERGLRASPHNLALLCTKVLLAEKLGDTEQAVEALKLVVHLKLEARDGKAARDGIERLKDLDADDPFVWEKSFELALEHGPKECALADAKRLIELYRKPGLHKKTRAVFERLITAQGESWELVRELARARVDAGEPKEAVKGLEKFGAKLLERESYPLARRVQEEILAIDPKSTRAQTALAEIVSGALAQRRARWRKIRLRIALGLCACIGLPWFGYEALARRSLVKTTRAILREGLIESGKYAQARQRYAAIEARYAWSTTALYELPRLIAELDAKSPASK